MASSVVPDHVASGEKARLTKQRRAASVFPLALGMLAILMLPGCHKKKAHAAPAPTPSASAVPVPPSATSAAVEAPAKRPGMLVVPAGTFTMGDDAGSKAEKPAHRVTITKAFLIDETEVTVDAYRKCVDAGKCSAPSIHRPDISAEEVAKFTSMCN